MTLPLPKTPTGLKAKAKANPQLVVGVGAVAVVVVLALMSKHNTGPGSAGPTVPAATAGSYDSSMTDFYKSVSGQMGNLQDQIGFISGHPNLPIDTLGATTTTTAPGPSTPSPTTPAPSTPRGPYGGWTSFYRTHQNGNTYGVTPAGVATHLAPWQYAAAGAPKVEERYYGGWTRFTKSQATGNTYGITPGGVATHLAPWQYAAAGSPKVTMTR